MASRMIAQALEWRYATKQFDKTKQIPDEDLHELRNAIAKTPTSFGLQPWKVIEVRTPELRAKLREASWNQSQVTDASAFFIFTAKRQITPEYIDAHVKDLAQARKIDVRALDGLANTIKGFTGRLQGEQQLYWAQRQAYIGLGFLLEAAALMQIDATPMEGFDPAKYDEILNLKDHAATVACAVGYRHSEDSFQKLLKHRRKDSDLFETR